MKLIHSIRFALFLLPLTLFTGCAELGVLKPQPDTTRFYFLESTLQDQHQVEHGSDGLAILVGPSTVAKYLDQSQIVTLEGRNELVYSDRNRWAEPLEESINRLLIYHLGFDLQTARVGFSRMMSKFDYDYRVGYHIYELEGRLNKDVRLKVGWWVLSRDGEKSHYDGAIYQRPVEDDSYQAYVEAIQLAITDWSNDVTAAIRELENQPSANSMSTSGSDPTSR